MELRIHSAGKIQTLSHRFFPDIPNHNTKIFWLSNKQKIYPPFSPSRGMNYYIDIGPKIRLKPDHLYILPSFSFTGIISDENRVAEIYFIHLDITPPLQGNMFEINVQESDRCRTLLNAITALITETTDILAPMLNSLFACPEISDVVTFSSNKNISRVTDYIHRNYSQQLKNTDLAAIAGYNTNYFIKAFRAETGESPHVYIQNIRLINAMNMLRNGSSPKQVAVACGYNNQNEFYRIFKKYFSKPPSFFYRSR